MLVGFAWCGFSARLVMDLKSVVRKDVRVRLPPSAPLQNQWFTSNDGPAVTPLFFSPCVPIVCQQPILHISEDEDGKESERHNLADCGFPNRVFCCVILRR